MTIQNTGDFEIETGLEDFGMADTVIPRLKIMHREGRFVDSLSNEEFEKVTVVMLGLVRQRILWHTSMDDDDAAPMCKSTNFEIGFPDLNAEDQPKNKLFPWEASGFNPDDFKPGADGLRRLPCAGCQLKEWGSHPDGKKPYCSEQFTIPLLYDPSGGDNYVPAIISFQKTSLKPLKNYLSAFKRGKTGAFSVMTEMGLDLTRRGANPYSVPNFRNVGPTDSDEWPEYATAYRQLRDFLTADPERRDDEEGSVTVTAKADPWAGAPTAADEEVVDGEVVEDTPVEDVPAEAEPTPPPPAPAKKVASPVPPVAKKAAAAPPAAAPAAAAEDDDDLPF
jgi:hypothetical protein